MIKMELDKGQFGHFETDENGVELAADVCVIMKRCADEFVKKSDINSFMSFMMAMEQTLKDSWFETLFGIEPPSKFAAGKEQSYESEQ